MAVITEKLNIIAEEINLFLDQKFVSPADMLISPEGNLNVMNINVGFVYYNQTGIARLFYEKTGLQKLMAKVYNN